MFSPVYTELRAAKARLEQGQIPTTQEIAELVVEFHVLLNERRIRRNHLDRISLGDVLDLFDELGLNKTWNNYYTYRGRREKGPMPSLILDFEYPIEEHREVLKQIGLDAEKIERMSSKSYGQRHP